MMVKGTIYRGRSGCQVWRSLYASKTPDARWKESPLAVFVTFVIMYIHICVVYEGEREEASTRAGGRTVCTTDTQHKTEQEEEP